MTRHVHAAQHIIGEKEFSIRWHHHDLELVGEALGHDLVNQQRILLEDGALSSHAFGISGRGHADAVSLGVGKQLAAFHFSLAVDDLRLGRCGLSSRR